MVNFFFEISAKKYKHDWLESFRIAHPEKFSH